MNVRNVIVTGIFVWDNNFSTDKGKVEFTIGDILIYANSLYKCKNNTSKNPDEDYYSWEHIDPTITNPTELINGGDESKFVDARTVRESLFGDSGIAKFLTPNGSGTTYINSWGKNLSEIDHTSTYAVTIGAAEITDWPPLVYGDGPGIVNTFVNGSQTNQELISFDSNGKVLTYSVRIKTIDIYAEWETIKMNNSESEIFNNFLVITKLFRKLLKYHEQTAEKYTVIAEGEYSELDPGYDNLPMYNIMVQVKYEVKVNEITQTSYKWVTIFKSDLDDSTKVKIVLDSFANSDCNLYIENRIIKVENGVITKLIKFIGNDTENSDGSDYFRFGYSE